MPVVLLIPKTRFSSQDFPPFCQNKKDLTTIPFWYHNQVFKNRIQFSNALNINALLIFLILLVRLNEVSFFFAYGLVEFIYVNLQTHRIIRLYADVDQLNYRLYVDALGELIDASSLPFFNSDQMLRMGYAPPERISLPIRDPEAHTTYWIASLTSEYQKYRSVFNAVRGSILRNAVL